MQKLLAVVSLAIAVQSALGVAIYGQCGGIGYSGSTTCTDSGTTCQVINEYYYQCLPGTAGTTVAPTTATVAPTTATATSAPPTNTGGGSGTTLNAKFVSHGKKFWGVAADPGTLGNSASANIVKAQFGGVTPENSMKWDATESSRNSFTFGNADSLVNFAVTNGKLIRGHTLLWHSQLPNWVTQVRDKTSLTSVIENHITNVAGRFKGKLYAWDVVNEIFDDQNSGALRSSVFSDTFGNGDFVRVAMAKAKSIDPTAIRYINDYNLEYNANKRGGLIRLVNSINSANPGLIQGIGTQTHLSAGGSNTVKAALTALAATGLDVAITELDIRGASTGDYVSVVQSCLAEPKCVSITSWGVSDKDSWIRGENGGVLLYNDNYQPKAAYNAIMSAL